MRVIVLAWLVLAPTLASPALAAEVASPVVSVVTTEPRGFGYFVGDVFRREIDVVVAEPYRLDKASQPAPGRLNYWLDLRSVNVTETASSGARRYLLSLDYQTFYVPLSTTALTIPGLTLSFSSDKETVEAEVRPLSLVMSPLREVQPVKPEEGPSGYLRPDAVPRKIGTLNARIGVASGALLALLALTLLAYHQAWWPFRARPERPFTQAARAIKKQLAHGRGIEDYRAGLLDLHRAFDVAAGHRLLAEDVPGFLSLHQEYQPLGDDITRFFASSRRGFFGNDMEGAATVMPFDAVAALGSRLGEAERRAA